MSERLELAVWLEEMARLAGYPDGLSMVAVTGADCWMAFFEDDYTPAEAWAEECRDD